MPSVGTIKRELPPYEDKRVVLVTDQGTKDIINEILHTHNDHKGDYDRIYRQFDCDGDTNATCKKIWDFLKYNLKYRAESGEVQSVRSPAAILSKSGVDCKHYSLFIAGVLDAIKRNQGDAFDWVYRFASYNHEAVPGHVFVVVNDNGNEYWVDPVLDYYNERKRPTYKIDKKPKMSNTVAVSGCGCQHGNNQAATSNATQELSTSDYVVIGAVAVYALAVLRGLFK